MENSILNQKLFKMAYTDTVTDLGNELYFKENGSIYLLNTKKNKFNVSCYKIDECLKDIYNQEDNLFDANYVTHGFSINELNVMAYSDEMLLFLNENNLEYKINKE